MKDIAGEIHLLERRVEDSERMISMRLNSIREAEEQIAELEAGDPAIEGLRHDIAELNDDARRISKTLNKQREHLAKLMKNFGEK